jgi:hypothetical protein
MKKLYILLFVATIIGCTKRTGGESIEENFAPNKPILVFPADNELCTDKILKLEWQESLDADGDDVMYLIQVATDAGFTSVFHESTISETFKELTFESSKNYYWRVKAIDELEESSDFSSVNSFYSDGVGVENHVPFSPELIAPSEASSVASGSVKLEWNAIDLDSNDVLNYEVFVGTSKILLESKAKDIGNKFYTTTINTGITYYWRVDVKDSKGGVTIGQVWSFTSL